MISDFIQEIEEAISSSSIVISSDIQKYFSASKKEAYIRGSLHFVDLSSLDFALYILEKGNKLIFDKYRFQYMDHRKRLIFRSDNAQHYKDISTFPYHKHLHNNRVVDSAIPEFNEILEEITALIAKSTS